MDFPRFLVWQHCTLHFNRVLPSFTGFSSFFSGFYPRLRGSYLYFLSLTDHFGGFRFNLPSFSISVLSIWFLLIFFCVCVPPFSRYPPPQKKNKQTKQIVRVLTDHCVVFLLLFVNGDQLAAAQPIAEEKRTPTPRFTENGRQVSGTRPRSFLPSFTEFFFFWGGGF